MASHLVRPFSFLDPNDQHIFDAMMATRVSDPGKRAMAFMHLIAITIPYTVAELRGKWGKPEGFFITGLDTVPEECIDPRTNRAIGLGRLPDDQPPAELRPEKNRQWITLMSRRGQYFYKRCMPRIDMVLCIDDDERSRPVHPLQRLFLRLVEMGDTPHNCGRLVPLDLRVFLPHPNNIHHEVGDYTSEHLPEACHTDWLTSLWGNMINCSGGDMQTTWREALSNPESYRKKEEKLRNEQKEREQRTIDEERQRAEAVKIQPLSGSQ